MIKRKKKALIHHQNICRIYGGLALIDTADLTAHQSLPLINTGATVADCMQMPMSFWMLDTNSITQAMNAEGIKVCGFQSEQDAIGHSLIQVSTHESAIQLINNCNEVLHTQSLRIFEEYHIRKDGIAQQFLSIKLPWYDLEQGDLIGVCGFSIVLGRHSLANNLSLLAQYGMLDASNTASQPSILPPNNIHSLQHLSIPPREKQCLQLIAQGYTAKMMARELGLSYRTIESYIDNLKTRLGVNSKFELIQIAKY